MIYEVHDVLIDVDGERHDDIFDTFATKEEAEHCMFEFSGENDPDAEGHYRYDLDDPDEYMYCIERKEETNA